MNLDRAHRDLEAAGHLLTNGFPTQATSRAYYSAFNRLVVKEGGLDRAAGRWLGRLFDDRSTADYQASEVDREAAERMRVAGRSQSQGRPVASCRTTTLSQLTVATHRSPEWVDIWWNGWGVVVGYGVWLVGRLVWRRVAWAR